jgi:hypothetical protein
MCEGKGKGARVRRSLREVALEHHDGELAIALLWLQMDPRDPEKLNASAVAHFTALRDLGERMVKVADNAMEAADPDPDPRGMASEAKTLAALAVVGLRLARDMERLARRAAALDSGAPGGHVGVRT